MHNSGLLGYSVRELMQRAAKLILRESEHEPDLDRRLDIFHNIEVWDAKLNRWHPLEVRLRVTVRSLILGPE